MVRIARERYPNIEFRTADIEKIEGWGETFDVVIMSDVVGHLMDIEETFRQLHIFCRPDTRLIISYYNFFWEPILKMGEMMGLMKDERFKDNMESSARAFGDRLERFGALETSENGMPDFNAAFA